VVTGPSGPVNLEFDPRDGKGHFMAKEFGMHEVIVTNEGEAVKGAPNYIRYRRTHKWQVVFRGEAWSNGYSAWLL
jgi:hypothetical protein